MRAPRPLVEGGSQVRDVHGRAAHVEAGNDTVDEDRLRRRRPTEELVEWHHQDESPGPMQGLQQHQTGQWLKRAIGGLKEPYRSLVVLRDIHQHSYEEVAVVLELSLSQVKVYLHRARKQLRKQLAEVRP